MKFLDPTWSTRKLCSTAPCMTGWNGIPKYPIWKVVTVNTMKLPMCSYFFLWNMLMIPIFFRVSFFAWGCEKQNITIPTWAVKKWFGVLYKRLKIGITISYQYLLINQPVSWKITKVFFTVHDVYHEHDIMLQLHLLPILQVHMLWTGDKPLETWRWLWQSSWDIGSPKFGSRLKSALPCSFISADLLRIVSTFPSRMSPRKSTLPALMGGMINGVQRVLLGNNQVVKKSCLEIVD